MLKQPLKKSFFSIISLTKTRFLSKTGSLVQGMLLYFKICLGLVIGDTFQKYSRFCSQIPQFLVLLAQVGGT